MKQAVVTVSGCESGCESDDGYCVGWCGVDWGCESHGGRCVDWCGVWFSDVTTKRKRSSWVKESASESESESESENGSENATLMA